jgi:hypothetical protein
VEAMQDALAASYLRAEDSYARNYDALDTVLFGKNKKKKPKPDEPAAAPRTGLRSGPPVDDLPRMFDEKKKPRKK